MHTRPPAGNYLPYRGYRGLPAYAYQANYVRPPVPAWTAPAYYRQYSYGRSLAPMPPAMAAHYRAPSVRPYVPNYYAHVYNRPVMNPYSRPYTYSYAAAGMPVMPQYRQAYLPYAMKQRYRPYVRYNRQYRRGLNQRAQFRPLSSAELASEDVSRQLSPARRWSGKRVNDYQFESQEYYFRPISG